MSPCVVSGKARSSALAKNAAKRLTGAASRLRDSVSVDVWREETL